MEVKRLRYFLAVARAGTVTAAAEQLHIAQPALSRQLRSLEAELGVALFDRAGPRLRLTSAGRQLIESATDLVGRADQIDSMAHHMAHGGLRRVVVAASDTTISEVLAPFVAQLAPADPFVSIRAVAAHQVAHAVMDGCDLGVAATVPVAHSMAWQPLTDVPLRAYVATDHPWAVQGRRSVELVELVREKLVLLTGEHPARTVIDQAVAEAELAFGEVEESTSGQMIQGLAAAGFGVGVVTDLPRFSAYPLLITTAGGNTLRLFLHACWSAQHYAAPAIASFVERLREFAVDQVHTAAWQANADGEC
ncbi:LysR family transcriptional regulator [Catenulispora sp. GP43]|uniref:LysR family transcriptional regulator n=1 Tax=Catenulispora sp. GP43 TaxID=3156263 RepID=UPI0035177EE9